jgi:DNA polymerase III epsilon subunit-like protein
MIGVIDVETGGYSLQKNGICEVAILTLDKDLNIIDKIQLYIKPYTRGEDTDELVSYKDDAMKVNGLSVELLTEKGLDVVEASKELLYFIESNNIDCFLGHNVKFDILRVSYLIERFQNVEINIFNIINTLQMAKSLELEVENNKLTTLTEHFKIKHKDSHTAEGDCRATLDLYKILLTI